jgi:transcription elongation factor GreA-like protein
MRGKGWYLHCKVNANLMQSCEVQLSNQVGNKLAHYRESRARIKILNCFPLKRSAAASLQQYRTMPRRSHAFGEALL